MSAHTKTPWQLLPEECDKPYIRIRGTVPGGRYKVANVLTPVHEGVNPREAEETRANARRIVACVNACEGISTELLEASRTASGQHGIAPTDIDANGCSTHPKARHGFARQASHSEGEYVCECAGFDPYDAGYQAGLRAALDANGTLLPDGYLLVHKDIMTLTVECRCGVQQAKPVHHYLKQADEETHRRVDDAVRAGRIFDKRFRGGFVSVPV